MRSKKLLVFLILILLLSTTNLVAYDFKIPSLDLPEPPAKQHGDEEVVPCTVGEMRQALYYYNLVPILTESYDEVSSIAYDFAVEAQEEKIKKENWRFATIILSAIATTIVTTLIVK